MVNLIFILSKLLTLNDPKVRCLFWMNTYISSPAGERKYDDFFCFELHFQTPCNSAFPSLLIAVCKRHMACCPVNFCHKPSLAVAECRAVGSLGEQLAEEPSRHKGDKPILALCPSVLCIMCANALRRILSCNLADLLSNPSFCTSDPTCMHVNCRPVADNCVGIEKYFLIEVDTCVAL